MDARALSIIKQIKLFKGVDDKSLEKLIQSGSLIKLEPNAYLFQEGEEADSLYITLSGILNVVKVHKDTRNEYTINKILPGHSIGEMALANQRSRTASIKAEEAAVLLKIPIKVINELILENKHPYLPFILNLQNLLVERLMDMNYDKVIAMESEVRYLNLKQHVSIFIIYVISILCVFLFITQWLTFLADKVPSTTYFTLPIMIVLTFVVCLMAYKNQLKPKDMGLTLINGKQSIYEAIIFSLPILLLMTLVKYLIVTNTAIFQNLPVIDFLYSKTLRLGSRHMALIEALLLNAAYIFFIVPMQEFLTRGILQGSLEKILENNNKWYPIIISNLIFGALHVFLSSTIAFISFVSGIYFGWLYSRTKTLIGPLIAHVIVGVWGFSILNFPLIFD